MEANNVLVFASCVSAESYILMNADSGRHSILVLLDFSAAFGAIDHTVFLDRLKHWVGIELPQMVFLMSYREIFQDEY